MGVRMVPSYLLKLGRADKHLATLDRKIDEFLDDEDLYSMLPHSRPDRLEHWFEIVEFKQPPTSLSPIIGDALTNLRATLDHIVYALADPAKRGDKSWFPITFSEHSFKSEAGARLRGIPADPFAFIKQQQPYNRPNGLPPEEEPLAVLNHLVNIDKHRYVQTALGDVQLSETAFPNLPHGGTVKVTRPSTGLVKPKTELARFLFIDAGDNPAMGMNVQFAFRVTLVDPEGGDVALGPVDVILAVLRREVGRVTDSLAKYLP